jgi:hypothetical protein
MAKTKISEFDVDPANNTDINSINIAEGCAPSGINNAIRQLMSDLKEFQTGAASDPLTVGGVATFTAGTVSAPAITTTGDTNTGIFFPAADTIAFTEGGTEAMRIDSSGSVGIGTSSPAVSGLEISRDTGAASPTPAELRISTTTNDTGWSTTNPWGRISFYSADASIGGAKIHAAIETKASFTNGGYSNLDFLVTDSVNGTLFPVLSFQPAGTNNTQTVFYAGASGTERMRITSDGNVGIGTSSPLGTLDVGNQVVIDNADAFLSSSAATLIARTSGAGSGIFSEAGHLVFQPRSSASRAIIFANANPATEKMRIDSSGNLLVGKTASSFSVAGGEIQSSGRAGFIASGIEPLVLNRLANDGVLISLRQAGTQEGSISVSGTTVSLIGGHLARWSQLLDNSKDESILKGTVLSNLDEMCVWEKDGVVADNEQLNKMKVSDVEGDTNVAGVFVNWTIDEDYGVDDMNIAMTGDMIIRIAQGVTVQRGDLLMSAGDGTAKPQGDDIVRSKTIAKVTSTHVTCTYADGSYCVPCVLMAC